MNKIGLLSLILTLIFVYNGHAQDDDGTQFLGSVIEKQLGDYNPVDTQDTIDPDIDISQDNEPEPEPVAVIIDIEESLIDPDFLLDDGGSYDDYAKVSVRILDKITADTKTFDLDIGKTVAFGSIRIRPMACKKAPPIEEPESASFLQIWEKVLNDDDQWVFSGWMFASSPSLSAMEHPVYDVWVIDCKD